MSELSDSIFRLKTEGLSYKQICKELGCSLSTVSYHLGTGQKLKNLERQRVNKKKVVEFIQDYKQGKECVDCKEKYPYWILEFDHLGDKLFTIGSPSSRPMALDKIKEEIKKCEIVCANCHRNRTFSRSIRSLMGTKDVSNYYE